MADSFTPINTQEEFDNAIKARLERERATISKKYEGYDQMKTDYETLSKEKESWQKTEKEKSDKIAELEKQLTEANTKVSSLELEDLRTQVAIEKGLPMSLRGRLNGTTKEDLEKDADSLAGIFKEKNNANIPGFEPGDNLPQSEEAKKRAEYKSMLGKLRKGE